MEKELCVAGDILQEVKESERGFKENGEDISTYSSTCGGFISLICCY
ncbi:MAG: hypothetical protein Q4F41_03310 [Eubacteriales bacterium]|nr:hypothetical protein [Eubacteriales bacterium]